jgi:hypothetical protein
MKKVHLLSLLAVLVLSTSRLFAGATAVTTVTVIPADAVLEAFACTNDHIPPEGEPIALSGNVRITFHVTSNPAGGVEMSFEGNPQGVSGVGTITGTSYRLASAVNRFNTHTTADGAFQGSWFMSFTLIGQGSVSDLFYRSLLHYTVNPNGTVTGYVSDESISCK